jgi:hypothetical protein
VIEGLKEEEEGLKEEEEGLKEEVDSQRICDLSTP